MNVITLKDFMKCAGNSITGGQEYLWHCYGESAMSLDHWNGKHGPEGKSLHCVFDIETAEVYEMQAWDYKNNREYRWTNPDFLQERVMEAMSRGIDDDVSIDDRKFIDLELAEDMIEKATAIMEGKDYDERILINLNMTQEEELLLMRAAHKKDMSVNEFVEMALKEKIDELNGICNG